ncbi:MAG TPA: chromosome segregation protein SMC, partial [Deltaproteobacteria bacterium]|nr:chromosome segregation protein SMC [Deltaproteobacteria bacterium]
EEIKTKIMENETLIAQKQQELYEAKTAISIKEKNIEFAHQQIGSCSERKTKDLAEIQALKTRKEDLSAEIRSTQEQGTEADARIAALKNELNDNQRQIQQLIDADKQINSGMEEKKSLYIDIVTEKAKFKNMISILAKNIEDFKRRQEREIREIDEAKKKQADLTDKLQSLEQSLAQAAEELSRLEEKRQSVYSSLEQTKESLQLSEAIISQAKEEIGSKASRLNSLKEFQESFKWGNEGVRSVIEAQEGRDKFHGVVADHISVPREYETAVEAVLGEKLHYVIAKSQEDGVWAIDYLKNYQLGRGSFMPQQIRNHNDKFSSGVIPKEAEPLLEKVSVSDDFRPIAECLLSNAFLVSSIEDGLSLWRKNGFYGTLVTREGDIVTPQGVVSGGSGAAVEKSILSTKREITELEEEVASLGVKLQEQVSQKANLSLSLTRQEEEITQIKAGMHALEIDINGRKKDQERFSDEINNTKQRLAALEFNLETIKAEESEAVEKIEFFNTDISKKEQEELRISRIISDFTDKRDQSRATIEERERALTGKKIELAALEEKRDADLRALARLQNDINTIVNEINAKEEEITACDSQISELTASIETETASLKEFYGNLENQETALNEQKAGQSNIEEGLKSQENELRDVKRKLDDHRQKSTEMEILCRETVLNAENLVRSITEKYDVDWEGMFSAFTKVDEEKIAYLNESLEKDRQTVNSFGEVNLLAISEFEELDTRYKFLSEQIADLNSSLNTLQRTITRINKISRTRFADTFAAINDCFKEVFAHIFPGGRGQLLLTDENDLLETGVDIDIQIPGKKAQSVSLLSGGEKSLAAVALIFSILMYRPSPFLVLDEVDAALDDANTNLFNNLIKDVSQKSQVVMITHNKTTMEVADTLFGVTMQKSGISSLVSVNLN